MKPFIIQQKSHSGCSRKKDNARNRRFLLSQLKLHNTYINNSIGYGCGISMSMENYLKKKNSINVY